MNSNWSKKGVSKKGIDQISNNKAVKWFSFEVKATRFPYGIVRFRARRQNHEAIREKIFTSKFSLRWLRFRTSVVRYLSISFLRNSVLSFSALAIRRSISSTSSDTEQQFCCTSPRFLSTIDNISSNRCNARRTCNTNNVNPNLPFSAIY